MFLLYIRLDIPHSTSITIFELCFSEVGLAAAWYVNLQQMQPVKPDGFYWRMHKQHANSRPNAKIWSGKGITKQTQFSAMTIKGGKGASRTNQQCHSGVQAVCRASDGALQFLLSWTAPNAVPAVMPLLLLCHLSYLPPASVSYL